MTTGAAGRRENGGSGPGFTLAAAAAGFFMITLDAVIVNIALPTIRHDLGGGITGLQWVADGYTLMFAGLLLSAGSLSDRVGARRAFTGGLSLFAAASAACGLAPGLGLLVTARSVQGMAAAVMMPSSMALISLAYPDPARRARAIAVWAVGGAAASSSGPLLGGLLSTVSWRLIFFVNVPAGLAALALLSQAPRSPRHPVPFDWAGQVTAVLAMGGLTYATIEAGAQGFTAPTVLAGYAVAVTALPAFLAIQAHTTHPMVPLALFRERVVSLSVAVGFAWVVGYYGLPFVMSLYLQQVRHLSALAAGIAFLPMMLTGAALTPFSARLAERLSPRVMIAGGMAVMAAGLAVLAAVPPRTPVWILSALMGAFGVSGPAVMPPVMGVLLGGVHPSQAGTASGIFNAARQVGGALAVALFGAMVSNTASFAQGLRASLLTAAGTAFVAGAASWLVHSRGNRDDPAQAVPVTGAGCPAPSPSKPGDSPGASGL